MTMRLARTQLRAPRPYAAPRQVAAVHMPEANAASSMSSTPSTSTTAAEVQRKHLVNVVLVIYLLAILEGALRKYVAPQFGQYIFFIRDPFLLYAYIQATRHGLWPPRGAFFQLSIAMCFIGALLFVAQFVVGSYSEPRLVLGVHGWRSYFLYVPLAFLVGAQFSAADLARFSKITLWLAIPIAVLVVAQFSSPINAPINVGVSEDKDLQFKGMVLDVDHVRSTGPFTSPAGLQQFTVSACAFLLAALLLPAARRPLGLVPTLAAGGAVLTCVALSGSRGTLLQCVLTAVFAVLIGAIGRGTDLKAKALALPTSIGALAVVLYPIVFPTGFEVFMNRWNGAAVNEKHIEGGLVGRTWYTFIDFVHLLDDTPFLGYGLGYGSNASIQMNATVDGVRPGAFVEADFARHMVDLGPMLGLCYIAFRLALLAWLGQLVLRATRSAPDPLPMLLFSYTGYTVMIGQITGNGSINVYGWLFVGLCIAACRIALQGPQRAVPLGAGLSLRRLRWPARSLARRPSPR